MCHKKKKKKGRPLIKKTPTTTRKVRAVTTSGEIIVFERTRIHAIHTVEKKVPQKEVCLEARGDVLAVRMLGGRKGSKRPILPQKNGARNSPKRKGSQNRESGNNSFAPHTKGGKGGGLICIRKLSIEGVEDKSPDSSHKRARTSLKRGKGSLPAEDSLIKASSGRGGKKRRELLSARMKNAKRKRGRSDGKGLSRRRP